MNPGVLLINLGSPDSTSVPDVRSYLREFLMDGRVIDLPYPIRWGLLHLFILPTRPAASAHAYQRIWTKEGSPLVLASRRVQRRLEDQLGLPVELAMRYRRPSIDEALDALQARGANDIFLIPLFPHYAMASYETAVEAVCQAANRRAPEIELTVAGPYYDDPDYIRALAASAAPFLERDFDHLLLSFHGVPERHLKKADPTGHHCLMAKECCAGSSPAHATCYRAQCYKTAQAFAQTAQLPAGTWSVSFQSRLGRDAWLKPETEQTLKNLAQAGVKNLLVMCPAFVADCLETLEEIGMRGRDTFMAAGGTSLTLIPCLNDHPLWIGALERMTKKFLSTRQKPAGVALA
jgi:ferrochelatase